jgi:hypothetical protein
MIICLLILQYPPVLSITHVIHGMCCDLAARSATFA